MGGSMNGGGYSAPGQGVNLGSIIGMLGGQNTGGQGYGTPQAFNPYTQASRMAAQNAGGMGRQTQAMPYTGQQMWAAQQTPVGGRGVQTRAMPPTKSPLGIQIGSGKWGAAEPATQPVKTGGNVDGITPPVKSEIQPKGDLGTVTGDPPRLSLGADGNPTIAPMQGQSIGGAPVSGGGGRTPEQKADREYYKWLAAQGISDAQTRAGTNPWGVMGMPDPRRGGFDPNLYGQMSQLGQQNAMGREYAGMLPGMGYTGGTVNQGLLNQAADWQRQNTSFGTPDENGVLWMTVNSPSGPIRVPARQYGR